MTVTTRVKALVPWQLKIASKLVLSRLPVGPRTLQVLRLFRRGAMDEPAYAYGVFRRHFDRASFGRKHQGFVSLELGPGDSLFSCVIAKGFGASHTWLIDNGPFACIPTGAYQEMARFLRARGLEVSVPSGDVGAVLRACGATYGTEGLRSLEEIPTASVDWAFSHAVLEHIRKAEFLGYMRELRRVTRPDGIGSHRVDLRDHLSGALNNLRFPESIWESDWMARSGFYTNRIQFDDMCDLFERAGFSPEVKRTDRWPALPTPRRDLAEPFRSKSDDALLVRGFDILLRPR
jgi:SAM-dependent methyltransferase